MMTMKNVEEKYKGTPSTREEIEEAEDFKWAEHSTPFSYPTCYDSKGFPWTYYHGGWRRTETIGETPCWKKEDSHASTSSR